MEEKILEIIKRYDEMAFSRPSECAKEITAHVMEFIEWIVENNTKEPKWRAFLLDLLGTKSYTTEELYQYWLNNVKK